MMFFRDKSMKFAVIGLGLFGKKMALELSRLGHEVVAVDKEEEPVSSVQNEVSKAVIGDATQKDLITEIVSPDFDAAIVTMATNLEASLLIVLHMKEIGIENIIAKSNGPEHSTILTQLGVQKIILPEEDIAEQLANQIGRRRVLEYLELQDDYRLMEMIVPESFVGQNLVDLDLRSQYGVQVIGIQADGEQDVNFVPKANKPFGKNDVVWIIGPEESLEELSEN